MIEENEAKELSAHAVRKVAKTFRDVMGLIDGGSDFSDTIYSSIETCRIIFYELDRISLPDLVQWNETDADAAAEHIKSISDEISKRAIMHVSREAKHEIKAEAQRYTTQMASMLKELLSAYQAITGEKLAQRSESFQDMKVNMVKNEILTPFFNGAQSLQSLIDEYGSDQ